MIVHHPFAYQFGPIAFTGFGLAMLLAFLIAYLVGTHEAQRRGIDPTKVGDLTFAAMVGGLLGAKIYYVILTQDIHTLFSRGGFVFWGGLIGGMIGVAFTGWRMKLDLWQVADLAGLAVPAAYSIGRTGCWAVGDDYGRPSDLPWAVAFPRGVPPTTDRVHPTQLYEAIFLAVLAWLLIRWRRTGTPDRIVFRGSLPHTDTGKMLRRVVQQEMIESST